MLWICGLNSFTKASGSFWIIKNQRWSCNKVFSKLVITGMQGIKLLVYSYLVFKKHSFGYSCLRRLISRNQAFEFLPMNGSRYFLRTKATPKVQTRSSIHLCFVQIWPIRHSPHNSPPKKENFVTENLFAKSPKPNRKKGLAPNFGRTSQTGLEFQSQNSHNNARKGEAQKKK